MQAIKAFRKVVGHNEGVTNCHARRETKMYQKDDDVVAVMLLSI